MRLIINADDLGCSDSVNQQVFALMEAGRVTSATLLAVAPRFEAAANTLHRYARCSFGVHLCLTEFQPLTPPRAFRDAGLLDSAGCFKGTIRSIHPTASLKSAIYAEWCAQIDKVRAAGVPISHVDSHHHVHTMPWLFGVLRRVVRAKRISAVRKSMNWYYAPEKNPSLALRVKKQLWNTALRYACGVKTTEHFTSFDWFLRNMTGGEIRKHGTAELMVHPGVGGFEAETALLSSEWIARMPCEVKLMTYADL